MGKQESRTGVTMDVHVGDSVKIGDGIVIKIEHKSGQKARLRIVAPTALRIQWPKKIPATAG